MRVRPDEQRTTCAACGQEFAVRFQDGRLALKSVLAGEARTVGATGEPAQAAADRLRREIAELQHLMDRSDAESRRELRTRYTLARVGTALLAIGLAFRFLLRQQGIVVLVAALVGAVILMAALSSIKGIADAQREGRKLHQESLEAKEGELARLRGQAG